MYVFIKDTLYELDSILEYVGIMEYAYTTGRVINRKDISTTMNIIVPKNSNTINTKKEAKELYPEFFI